MEERGEREREMVDRLWARRNPDKGTSVKKK
jgi:hypothetical protein